MSFTMTVDTAKMAASLRKRSAEAVRRRAERFGAVAIEDIQTLIRSEVGSSGQSGRRGMTSLHSVPFRANVDSGTDLPITVTVTALVSGPTAAKFGAHNNGAGPHDIPGPLAFEGTNEAAGRKVVVHSGRAITHPGTPKKDWMRRGMGIAASKLRAGFIR